MTTKTSQKRSDVLCPKHHTPLVLGKTVINFAGVSLDMFVGKCSKCDVIYTGVVPINGISNFENDGVQFEYLPQLAWKYKASLTQHNELKERKKRPPTLSGKKSATQKRTDTYGLIKKLKESKSTGDPTAFYQPIQYQICKNRITICPTDDILLIYKRTAPQRKHLVCPVCQTAYYGWYNTIEDLILSASYTISGTSTRQTISVVEHESSQQTNEGIYWVHDKFAKDILLAVLRGYRFLRTEDKKINNLKCVTEGSLYHGYTKSFERFSPENKPVTVHLFAGKPAFGDDVEVVTALVYFPKISDYIPLPVYYSSKRHTYYINEFVYNENIQKYGIPRINVIRVGSGNGIEIENTLNESSLLFDLGYTVSQAAGMDDSARAQLLSSIIDSGKMKQAAIASHLEYLIRRNQHNLRFADARDKWKTDLQFVLSYNRSKQRTVYGNIKTR